MTAPRKAKAGWRAGYSQVADTLGRGSDADHPVSAGALVRPGELNSDRKFGRGDA
jgi:hypothetical protein